MSKQSARNYTPVFDDLVPKFGTMGALVFGVIWRYCQMRDGTCHASYETLAGEIGVTEKTIRNHVAKLTKNGLIKLHDRKNGGPYWITVSAELGSTRSNSDRNEIPDRVELNSGADRNEIPISNTKQETNRRPKKATPSRKRKRAPFWNEEQKVLADHFSEVSGLPIPKLEGRAFAQVTKSWKLPLSQMFELVGSVTDARKLIAQTVREMRADKLTISAPRSIWNVALSIHARGPTNGAPEPEGFAAIREVYGD